MNTKLFTQQINYQPVQVSPDSGGLGPRKFGRQAMQVSPDSGGLGPR